MPEGATGGVRESHNLLTTTRPKNIIYKYRDRQKKYANLAKQDPGRTGQNR